MLGIFINNSFIESNSKSIFKDTDLTHNPPFVFRTNYLQTNFSNIFIILIRLSHIIFLKTL